MEPKVLELLVNDGEVAYQLETLASIRAQMKSLEKREKETRAICEKYLTIAPHNEITAAGFHFSLTRQERENFALKAAKLVIPAEMLKPFLSTSEYTVIRIKEEKE